MVEVDKLPQAPERISEGHKGTFGRAMLVAGSRGMSGAAVLSGLGALRSGAGLVYVAVPDNIVDVVATSEPSFLTVPLPIQDGQLIKSATQVVQEKSAGMDAIGIGPGAGRSSSSDQVLLDLMTSIPLPMVVDADGLNVLAESATPADHIKSEHPRILTPHAGEFARLRRVSIPDVLENREEMAVDYAAQMNIVLVFKGHETLVTDGAKIYRNGTGNPGMATGGTGDVLTGLVTGLLAQGMSAFEAAQLGVFLHGLAGDLAAEELSQQGMIASDLAGFIPNAWKRYEAIIG